MYRCIMSWVDYENDDQKNAIDDAREVIEHMDPDDIARVYNNRSKFGEKIYPSEDFDSMFSRYKPLQLAEMATNDNSNFDPFSDDYFSFDPMYGKLNGLPGGRALAEYLEDDFVDEVVHDGNDFGIPGLRKIVEKYNLK